RHWLALSMILFAGAMLSCDSAITFPVLIGAHVIIMNQDLSYETGSILRWSIDSTRRAISTIWPYLAEVGLYLALRIWVLGFISRPNALNPRPLTVTDLALTIPGILFTDLTLLAMPWRASPAHHSIIAEHSGFASPGFYLPVLGLAILLGAALVLLRRHPFNTAQGRSHRRLYIFCAAWLLIGIGPVLNLNGLFAPAAIQDRYLYIPSFGFCLLAADLAVYFASGFGNPSRSEDNRRVGAVWAAAAVIAAIYALELFSVQRFWHDDVAVRLRDEQESPLEPSSHLNLAAAYEGAGNFAAARNELERAIQLDPSGERDAYHNIARLDERLGDRRGAELAAARWLTQFDHPSPGAYAELAMAADAAGDAKGTEAALARAATLPNGARIAALARAQLQFRHGDRAGAEASLKRILAQSPDDVATLNVLGAVLLAQQRNDEALAVFQRATSLVPRDATLHYRVAVTLHQMGREREALRECLVALAAAPNDAEASALKTSIERAGVQN
ncbi:MAG TPA: tetratricopeptide repeat protein, partial [Candidatus Binataceae bacterium]|nr:tetratricopeptide repeat protein [Candidatus Binataceae bacterium]